jgi:hypothetical protein
MKGEAFKAKLGAFNKKLRKRITGSIAKKKGSVNLNCVRRSF